MKKLWCCMLFAAVTFIPVSYAFDIDLDTGTWSEKKSDHFVIIYPMDEQSPTALEILRKAEASYNRILDRISSTKVDNFWTWDDRVKIIYFPDRESFLTATGQPSWSKGFSVGHATNFKKRIIVSFKGQDDFLDSVLPHEISHLVLHDYMKGIDIPRWFDEGVAQLDESNNTDEHRLILARLIASNNAMPVSMLEAFPSMINQDETKAAIFYAESLYIVDFLIKTYGKDNFAQLCRQMRDGLSFEKALKKVYYPTITSWEILEEKWNQYMLSLLHGK